MKDILLRKEVNTKGLLWTISIPQFDYVEEANIKWKQDEKIHKIIQELQIDPNSKENLCGRMVYFVIKICLYFM